MIRHLKPAEIAGIRQQILKKQGPKGGLCAICGQKIIGRDVAVLDHDHDTGYLRGVLHSSCNGIEGRMKSLGHRSHKGVLSVDYIIGLGKYLEHHKTPRIGAFHPSYRTPQQKKDATNAKARKARAAKRA